MILGVALAQPSAVRAQEPGLTIDPGSPSSKEYAIPFDQARRNAIGKKGAGSSSGSEGAAADAPPAPPFGEGIRRATKDSEGSPSGGSVDSSGSSGSGSAGAGPRADDGVAAAGDSAGSAESLASRYGNATDSAQLRRSGLSDGGMSGLVWSAVSALAVLGIALGTALVVRRRNSPDI